MPSCSASSSSNRTTTSPRPTTCRWWSPDGDTRRLEAFHWGLVPLWAKDPSVGSRMINARAEALADKNAFKHAFRKRRCLVPADGFYEWKKDHRARRRSSRTSSTGPTASRWPSPGCGRSGGGPRHERASRDEALRSCTIVTTDANETGRRPSTTGCR